MFKSKICLNYERWCAICGIAGYIGQSKKPKLTFELMTRLFDCLEIRGMDASGVWGTEAGEGGRIIYHKEPIRSSQFVRKDFWNSQVRKIKTNLLLVHARATSKGGGSASNNENNHPFVSSDKRIGMIHNGNLEEISFLKEKYQTVSSTDSEVLLRMYEHGLELEPIELDTHNDIAARMSGIKDIWSVISSGAMAVALGERVDDYVRYLFLFRNHKRPLWIADLRELFGQIFFFSSPDIWYNAISESIELKNVAVSAQKLIEIPFDQVWVFRIDEACQSLINLNQIERFEIQTKSTGKEWEAGTVREIPKPKVQLDVVSPADNKPKYLGNSPNLIPPKIDWKSEYEGEIIEENYDAIFESKHIEDACDQIADLAQLIQTQVINARLSNTLSVADCENILESLEQTKADLEGTLHLAST